MKSSRHYHPKDFVLYLEGEVTQTRANEIAEHLAICSPCLEYLEQDKKIISAFSVTDAELEGTDLVSAVRKRFLQEPKPAPHPWRTLLLALDAAACLLLIVLLAFFLPGESEFRVKGQAPAVFEQDRWVGLHVYHVHKEKPRALGAELDPGSDLLFAYSNAHKNPFKYLMIFAVDSRGSTFWFYPAYQQAGTDPTSIEISAGRRIELKERIHHAYAPGRLTIVALFTQMPVRVSAIEAMAGKVGKERLPIENSAQRLITTRIMP